jgi:hypothetical protein
MKIIGSLFSHAGAVGDFGWMIERPEFADALFIFNDNEEQFLAFLHDQTAGTYGCTDGSGNAVIRHYRCQDPPRAAGVPTGWIKTMEGYPQLTPAIQKVIDESFAVIRRILASGGYQRVFYSVDASGNLGHGIFDPADDVKRYIVSEFQKLGDASAAKITTPAASGSGPAR